MINEKNITRYGFLLILMLLGCEAIAGKADNGFSSAENSHASLINNNHDQRAFLEKLVAHSDLIFRGKLTEISEGLSIEDVPYTFVTYDVKEVIAGQYSDDTITLKFVGGTFPNGNRLSASNTPDVQLGEESILMVQQSRDTGCDFVNCEHGRFVVKNGEVIAANESAIVVDDNGGIDYISYAERKSGKHKHSLAKPNVSRFISHLKNLDKTSSAQKKGIRVSVSNTDKHIPFKAYSALTQAKNGPQVPKSAAKNTPRKLVEGSPHDQWEVEQLKRNGGNPVLKQSSQDN